MEISVVVPAHNEAALLPRCLASVRTAASHAGADLEVVVVANRCTDGTAGVAMAAGATVLPHEARNLAAVRNAGVAATTGEVVVTVDADCVVHPATFTEALRRLDDGRTVGGGVRVVPERRSPGILATYAVMEVVVAAARVGGGLFWTRRTDLAAVGGFDESRLVGEDVDLARRLRRHGRADGRRFVTLRRTPLTASCRKFDAYGDWHMFAMAKDLPAVLRSARGRDTEWVDRYFFDFND